MVSRVNEVAKSVGLSISAGETKVFSSCIPDEEKAPLGIDGCQLEEVDSVKYRGARLLPNEQSKDGIVSRIDAVRWVSSSLQKCPWIRRDLSIATKIRVYRASVGSVLLYGCKCWALRVEDQLKLEVFDHHCLRTIHRVKFTDFVSNETVRASCVNIARVTQAIQEGRLRQFGHLLRRPPQELSVTALDPAPLPHWRRRRGGQFKTWLDTVRQDMEVVLGPSLPALSYRFNHQLSIRPAKSDVCFVFLPTSLLSPVCGQILGNIYHPSTDSSSMLFFVTFCKKLLSVLVFRLRQELSRNPRSEEIYGRTPTWSRITVDQVDDVVDILLPLCLDASLYTRRSKSLDAVVACLDYLCLLRPRLFLPRLLTALEGGFELPELPMRVTRPLQALAESCSSITSLRFSLCWSSTEMGRQPGDQVLQTATQSSTGAVSKTPQFDRRFRRLLTALWVQDGDCRELVYTDGDDDDGGGGDDDDDDDGDDDDDADGLPKLPVYQHVFHSSCVLGSTAGQGNPHTQILLSALCTQAQTACL
ncbi:Proteasome activator complex subunit 4 [Sparganum proliferum]